MSSTPIVYEAPLYSREITYRNLNGEVKTSTLFFSLDPLSLMRLIGEIKFKTSKSNNPALKGQAEELDDGAQLKLVHDLACKAAGTKSEDGETWRPWTDFSDDIAGKAFLAKLTASDGDRREFSQKVILDPMRQFVAYAIADESNSPKEIQEFKSLLVKMENVFKMPSPVEETREEKAARLRAELAGVESEGTDSDRPVQPIFPPRTSE